MRGEIVDDTDRTDREGGSGPSMAWRWGLCWLMFGSTALSYVDRQSISLVAPYIKRDFSIGNEGFGWVLASFSLAYALAQVPAGYLADRGDLRPVYALAVGWWSLAAGVMAFSPTIGLLMAFRAMLGVGEAFNWPCALRATSAVLPPADRGLGNGIFNSGAAIGAVITPLIVPGLTLRFGWRRTFLIVASLGVVWVVAWLWMVRGPNRRLLAGRGKPRVDLDDWGAPDRPSGRARGTFAALAAGSVAVAASAAWLGQRALWWAIAVLMVGLLVACRALPMRDLKGSDWAEALGEVVRLRRFWVLAAVSISINVCWHFLVNWLPTYLKDDRGMTYLASGLWSALPFLAADLGNLGGGAASRSLARGGLRPSAARLRVMAVCTLLIAPGALVGRVDRDGAVMALLGVMAFGTAAFMANYFACCQEVSSRHTGFVVGVLGGLGNLFVAGFLPFAGHVKDASGSFAGVFLVAALLPIVGLGSLAVGWGTDPDEFRSASPGEVR